MILKHGKLYGVWSTCIKKTLNSSNLYCWIHHIPQMVSLYITYNTAEPKHKRTLTPIKYVCVAYVSTIEIEETDVESMTKYLWCRVRNKKQRSKNVEKQKKSFHLHWLVVSHWRWMGLIKTKLPNKGVMSGQIKVFREKEIFPF